VDGIVTGVRKEVRVLGLMDIRESCWKFFLSAAAVKSKAYLRGERQY